MAALRKQKDKTISGLTAKEIKTMANYYRITAYHPEKNIFVIMDSYGMFEKLWQFSAFLVEKGFDIIAVGKEDSFTDGNIERQTEPLPDKIMLRACALNKPNVTNGKIEVGGKFYTSNR